MKTNILTETVNLNLTIRDALRIVTVLGRANGYGDDAYNRLKKTISEYGDVNFLGLNIMDIPTIDYCEYQELIEAKFLRLDKTNPNDVLIKELEGKIKHISKLIEGLKKD